jgi:hypothetical protein
VTSPTHDEDRPGLAPGAAEVLQAATRVLAGVALRSLDVLDSAVTLPQFRLLAVLAGHVTRGGEPHHRGVVVLELTASGRALVAAADTWRKQELARILARLAPPEQEALTTALGLLVTAAGEGYGVSAVGPVPL